MFVGQAALDYFAPHGCCGIQLATMQPDEAARIIAENVSVTRQKIALMKRLVMDHTTFDGALKALNITRPLQVVLHPDVDPMPSLKRSSDWISYSLAGCEAVWELVHSGVLVQLSSSLQTFNAAIGWTTVHGTSGGMSAGWQFGQFESAFPSRFIRSWVSDRNQLLADADLYLQRLSLPNLHPDIEGALRDAVRCFRAELFTPALVMLRKASEGAWIELGVALSKFAGPTDVKLAKWADALVGQDIGFAKKLREIVNFYETRQQLFKPLGQQIGVALDDVRTAMLWSDTLRGARNAIHHRVSPTTDATYETVATLLLAAVPHLQTIYGLYSAAITATAQIP